MASGEGGAAGDVETGLGGSEAKNSAGAPSGTGGGGAEPARAASGGGYSKAGTGGRLPTLRGSGGSGGSGSLAGGSGGTPSGAAGEGGEAGSGRGGGAGAPDPLTICIRLGTSATFDDEIVTLDFENAFSSDCRVDWVSHLYTDAQRYVFLNQLSAFNYELWGCPGTLPPTGFGLIYAPHSLTQSDANALIDAYVTVATEDLSLSSGEIDGLRAWLHWLSEPLLVSPDPGGFSQPNCTTSAEGGAGGEGGAPAGGAASPASGGQAASAQAGTSGAGAG